ncbi:hypothetical protein SUGI_0371270 [Cryptomeria japonica]|nr:hypothetical protein SUGI_0371270 [Cryptomeria japonica]
MADIPRKNSCRVCLSSGTCIHHPDAQNKPLSVYSGVGQLVGKQKVNDEEHQMGIIGSYTEGKGKQECEGVKEDISEKRGRPSTEHSFLGSSVCYGGPDEYYGCVKERNEPINMNKIGVRKLEETADPSNLEYATRGDWWKGSVYNGKAGLSTDIDQAWNMISISLSFSGM